MATGGQDNAAGGTTDHPEVQSGHPDIFYNNSGRYQPQTGKNSAFEFIDLSEICSDTS